VKRLPVRKYTALPVMALACACQRDYHFHTIAIYEAPGSSCSIRMEADVITAMDGLRCCARRPQVSRAASWRRVGVGTSSLPTSGRRVGSGCAWARAGLTGGRTPCAERSGR